MMKNMIKNLLKQEGIELFGMIPLSACRIDRPYLLERNGISDGTVIMFAIPYYSLTSEQEHNLSVYAVPRDYHQYLAELSEHILPVLKETYPLYRFALFGDHSPINELDAAARSGIGVLGDNRMLLTERYSSFVFLAEIITTAKLDCVPIQPGECFHCGKCRRACSFLQHRTEECLSALSQKKGNLTPKEEVQLLEGGSVWGCDRCQMVCPYTERAKKNQTITTSIPYFLEHTIPVLTSEKVKAMSEEEFAQRAFSWRGRVVILRNLELFEQAARKEDSSC